MTLPQNRSSHELQAVLDLKETHYANCGQLYIKGSRTSVLDSHAGGQWHELAHISTLMAELTRNELSAISKAFTQEWPQLHHLLQL